MNVYSHPCPFDIPNIPSMTPIGNNVLANPTYTAAPNLEYVKSL